MKMFDMTGMGGLGDPTEPKPTDTNAPVDRCGGQVVGRPPGPPKPPKNPNDKEVA